MKSTLTAVLVIGVLTTTTFTQPPPRKPGAEEQRIGYFAGRWSFQGEAKASPMGPAGKLTGTENCEWFTGGFYLVCQTEGKGPMGEVKGRSTMGWDPAQKTYTYHAINNLGQGFFVRGNVSGKVWTWTFEEKMEGKSMKGRVTVTEETPTAYAFKMEASVDGSPMAVVEEGKTTKVK